MLDTTPNADINVTWDKLVRKRETEKEVGPPIRYTHRSTVERLADKAMQDPPSSELVGLSHSHLSPRKSM